MIRAVIFACDGLIVDTETPWYKAYETIYKEYGLELPLELYAECIGNTTQEEFDPHKYLEQQLETAIDRKSMEEKARKYHTKVMEGETLRPGVKSYIETAKALGLKVGLASSSEKEWVVKHLKRYDLLHFFDTIQTGNTVEVVKPHPELYENALKELGVTPYEAIAFEDSVNGLTAAKKAGIACVVIPNEATSVLSFENYDLRLTSMEEKNLEYVIKDVFHNKE
ncbi:HAD family hydrolase [Bacillus shivajii]|uniref:HAD family hydrolase n=1 Tax=Bacillus shivajii TaxID=1983719 RepID=UPI001CFB44E3|nr:HAD family hydrolase [Bacillus shivajii]